MKLASLCLLAYKRPQQLIECIQSLHQTADYPYELIVNLDGGDEYNIAFLTQELKMGRISKLILSCGNNRGVGRSFQNCLGVAEGDYIFKVDTDLLFKPNWLSTSVGILSNNPDVGAVSLFDYRNYDPNDNRFNIMEEREDCNIVDDFVSSIYGFKHPYTIEDWVEIPDDGFHQSQGGKLAITKEDYVINRGFGVGKSVYISGTEEAPFKTPTHDKGLIFKEGLIN